MKKANKKGFTIVELVIVIAVIAILAAVLIPTFSNVVEKANQSAALQNCRNELVEMKAAYAIKGEDVPEGIVFESGKYQFRYENGELISTKDTIGTATKLNNVSVFCNGVTASIGKNSADNTRDMVTIKYNRTTANSATLIIYNEDGAEFYRETSSVSSVNADAYFEVDLWASTGASAGGTWASGNNNLFKTAAEAYGYYTYTITFGTTVLNGIFYFGA